MAQVRLDGDEYDREWEKEWQDMPEFKQENKDCYATIIVRFDKKEDLDKFSKLVEQNLDQKTKSIWYPKLKRGECSFWRWVDEK